MDKVTGRFDLSVWVYCPYCEHQFDAANDIEDDDNIIFETILGSDKIPGIWIDLGIEIECPHCKKEIELTNLEFE